MPIIDIYRPKIDEEDIRYIFTVDTKHIMGESIEVSEDIYNKLNYLYNYECELQEILKNLLEESRS